jgi:hypothetical protein
MKKHKVSLQRLRRDNRAISPAISTVILTSAVIVLLLATIGFANNFLDARMAENEFSTMKQFMQTVGLQVDDVAWTAGRTQTIRYVSRFGQVSFESLALNYTVYVDKGAGYVYLANFSVGVLLFNMPTSKYSITNNYIERIFPQNNSFMQTGTSAPTNQIYVIEKLPMNDGEFIRVVVAPSIRMLNSTISTGGSNKNYVRFYLPILSTGSSPHYSQSVTLSGNTVTAEIESNINAVKIVVSFPKTSLGLSSDFFSFARTEEIVDVPDGSVLEFYTGEVIVSLGLHG